MRLSSCSMVVDPQAPRPLPTECSHAPAPSVRRRAGAALISWCLASIASIALLAAQEAPSTPAPAPGVEQRIEEVVAWINDDVVTWSELQDNERMAIAQMMEGKKGADALNEAMSEVRGRILGDLITDHLLIQEAERLFDIGAVEKDLIEDFKKRNQLKGDAELEKFLAPYDMTRDDLLRRLKSGSVPGYVIDSQVRRQLGVSQAEARAWYDQNLATFTTPAQVTFRELLLVAADATALAARRGEAEALLAAARSGDFAALVTEKSEAPSKASGGKVGPIDPNDVKEALRGALTTTPVGEIALVSSDAGWHLLRIEDRQDRAVKPFAEVQTECEEAVRREKSEPALAEYIAKLWRNAQIEVRTPYADRLAPNLRTQAKLVP